MDNKRKCVTGSFWGFLGIVVLGTLFHFAYIYSGYSSIVGAFTPVNESVWEHLKLLIFPAIIISVIEYFVYGKNTNGFITSKILSMIIGAVFVIAAFYTYTGALGNHSFIADIIIFITSAAITSALSCYFINNKLIKFDDTKTIISVVILTAVIILFVYFTFDPPNIELFRDPISEDFGIQYDM